MNTGAISTDIPERIDPAEKKLVEIEATKKKIYRGILIFWLVVTVFLFLRIFLRSFGADSQAFL